VKSVFLAPKMQPVWHHLTFWQRTGLMARGTRSQVWPAALSVAAHRPPDFYTLFQLGRFTRSPFSTLL